MKILVNFLLVTAVFISAVEIITTQHQARKLFAEIQHLERIHDELNEEWGKLQLEQSTWATNDRIENIARKKLDMVNPESNMLVLLTQ